MSAPALLAAAEADGVTVRLADGQPRAAGPREALERWLPELRAAKPELLALLTRHQVPVPDLAPKTRADIAEAIEKRAGGASREEAEREAQAEVRVYRLLIAMGAGEAPKWVTLLAPGCDLSEAVAEARGQFGEQRVLEVIEHRNTTL